MPSRLIVPGDTVVDYAAVASRPSVASLKAAGVDGVVRYLAKPTSSWKTIGLAEAAELLSAGIAVILNWEQAERDPLKGFTCGREYGARAELAADSLGYPEDLVILHSVDFDASAAQMAKVLDYFRGVRSIATRPVGVYGSARTVDQVMGAGLADLGWQTKAWSAGRISGSASMLQGLPTTSFIPGHTVDVNQVLRPVQAWAMAAPTPPPPPTPTPPPPVTVETRKARPMRVVQFQWRKPDPSYPTDRTKDVVQGTTGVHVIYGDGSCSWVSNFTEDGVTYDVVHALCEITGQIDTWGRAVIAYVNSAATRMLDLVGPAQEPTPGYADCPAEHFRSHR